MRIGLQTTLALALGALVALASAPASAAFTVDIQTPATLAVNANPFEGTGTLDSAVSVNAAPGGGTSIAAGTAVDSYMFLLTNSGGGTINYTYQITFDQAILGILTSNSNLDAAFTVLNTDAEGAFTPIARDGTYNGTDSFSINGNELTVTFNGGISTGTDPFRVITAANIAAVPEPASMLVWASLAAVGGVLTYRRRKAA